MNIIGWLICVALIVSACASTRTSEQVVPASREYIEEQLQRRSNELVSLHADGSLWSAAGGTSNQVQFSYDLYRTDSLLMTLYGPFGILVGKLQADPSSFSFFDALNNEIYEGQASRKNFERILNIPLSQREMALLLRGEPLQPLAEFELAEAPTDSLNINSTTVVLIRRRDGIAERLIFSLTEGAIVEYARKNASSETIMLVRYSNFETVETLRLAQKVTFQFPKAEISVNLQSSSVSANVPGKKYSFVLPRGVKRNRY